MEREKITINGMQFQTDRLLPNYRGEYDCICENCVFDVDWVDFGKVNPCRKVKCARTKDITDNLDKVWAIYDGSPFDLLDDDCISWLASYLEKLFSSAECKNFLECKTQYIHGIHIPK